MAGIKLTMDVYYSTKEDRVHLVSPLPKPRGMNICISPHTSPKTDASLRRLLNDAGVPTKP